MLFDPFPGKERDNESGNDYFGARYYESGIGRWVSPDWSTVPGAVPYGNFGNPQSLNLYSDLENNPTSTLDPDGHGSIAYLNVVFKAAPSDVLSEVGSRMKFPRPVSDLLALHNGAMFFSEALSFYGVVRGGQKLNRTEPFSLPPYNIESENRAWPPPDRDRFLKIGSYGLDGSAVCIDRQTNQIVAVRRRETDPFARWASLDDWLGNELRRLSELFDPSGRRLTSERETLPPRTKEHA